VFCDIRRMARPRKNNADYFPHIVEERNTRENKAIRNRFGHVGYSVITMLKEMIAASDNFYLKIQGADAELIAGDLGVTTTEMMNIVNFCTDIGYLQTVDKVNFTCEQLIKDLDPMLQKRELMRQQYRNRGVSESETREERGVLEETTPQSKDRDRELYKYNNNDVDNSRRYGEGFVPIGKLLPNLPIP